VVGLVLGGRWGQHGGVSESSPLLAFWRRARDLLAAGDPVGARAVLEHAVELGKSNLPEGDPDVLRTAFELGRVLQQVDDPMAARRVLEEAYSAGQRRLGDSDALMVRISHGIGVVADELGNRHEARKAFGRVVEFGPAALGSEHAAVAQARAFLGTDVRRESAAASVVPFVDSASGPAAQTGSVMRADGRREPAGAGRRWVQPPSAGNRRVRTGPAEVNPVVAPVEQSTAVQPVVGARVPVQRSAGVQPLGAGQGGSNNPTDTYVYGGSRPYSRGGLGVFAVIAAGLAVVIAVAALVFVLANRSGDSDGKSDVPTLAGVAPGDVALDDGGSTIGVSWKDPAQGSVSFMVIMGRRGLELKPVGTLGPGQTSFEMSGLNPRLNYCFAVVAVYRGNQFATSPQACTSRASATPR